MSFIDDALNMATEPVPGAQPPDEQRKVFDAMGIAELAETWRALQQVGYRDKTVGTWAAFYYFDSLPHEQPERALDLALEVLRTESDIPTLLQLGDKFAPSLIFTHGAALIDRLEREAPANARLRWLLGCVYWWTQDETLKARLSAIADKTGWREVSEAHDRRNPLIDFAAMTPAQLAPIWIAQNGCPEKDRDQNWSALRDYQDDLRADDPERALAIILAILKIETNDHMLGYLAAGPLEDLISLDTIALIEREAARNPDFRRLLGGVWYNTAPDALKVRLDAIIQGAHW